MVSASNEKKTIQAILFDEYHPKWRNGEISMREAAKICGMPKSSFYGAAVRKEQADICAVG